MADKHKPSVLITGITGQTGSYMAHYLLENGYEVFGMKRRTSTNTLENIKDIENQITLVEGDLGDSASINKAVKDTRPDYLFSYAAQSHVHTSFSQPELTADITGIGALRLLEAVKTFSPHTRFLNSATSEMFGGETGGPYNENSPFVPRSPYGCSKLYAYHITENYRQAYGLFACSSITFNHDSPKRGPDFLTRKLTQAATKIKLGLQKQLKLGNLAAKRDILHAKDVIKAQLLMLQRDTPTNYVIGSGVAVSIQEMVEFVFNYLGMNWKDYVVIDPKFYRPTEVNVLCADYSKIKSELGWSPTIKWQDLLIEMVEYDLQLIKNELKTK